MSLASFATHFTIVVTTLPTIDGRGIVGGRPALKNTIISQTPSLGHRRCSSLRVASQPVPPAFLTMSSQPPVPFGEPFTH